MTTAWKNDNNGKLVIRVKCPMGFQRTSFSDNKAVNIQRLPITANSHEHSHSIHTLRKPNPKKQVNSWNVKLNLRYHTLMHLNKPLVI